MKHNGKFVLRVYGIVVNKKNEVLLSDEFVLGMKMTKFPGGGMKFGEGTKECLKREFKEECNGQEIKNISHFYTTDFYQEAFFFEETQLISIYYLLDIKPPLRFEINDIPFHFEKSGHGNQSFRWKKIKDLEESEITFPIDKFVVRKLKKTYFENH